MLTVTFPPLHCLLLLSLSRTEEGRNMLILFGRLCPFSSRIGEGGAGLYVPPPPSFLGCIVRRWASMFPLYLLPVPPPAAQSTRGSDCFPSFSIPQPALFLSPGEDKGVFFFWGERSLFWSPPLNEAVAFRALRRGGGGGGRPPLSNASTPLSSLRTEKREGKLFPFHERFPLKPEGW